MPKWKAYQSFRIKMELPVVNHEDYFAKIGDDHKFPINKFGELAKYLIKQKIVKGLERYPFIKKLDNFFSRKKM